jgi:hypothetical protein
VTKTTTAYIGNGATVTGRGFGAGLTVKQGVYTVTTLDTRFNGNSVEGDGHTLNLGFAHGFGEGEQVTYDNGGGTSIGGLSPVSGPARTSSMSSRRPRSSCR